MSKGKKKAQQTARASKRVRCPKCDGLVEAGEGQDTFWCIRCRAMFDDQPDEGGDYSDRDPSARMEREERAAAERKRRR